MDGEVGAAVWIPVAVTVLVAILAGGGVLWRMLNSRTEKDIERVELHTKEEIARVDKRIDAVAVDQVKLHERTAVAERDIKRAQDDIGDHGTGLRGWLHEIANAVNPVVQWFGLRDRWKDDNK